MINYSIYYLGDGLKLPHSIRTYFDSGASECNDISSRQKLLDIGYLTTMGYDFFQDIQEVLESHPYISERDIKISIARLTEELSRMPMVDIIDRYENVPLKMMLEDFKELIINQYILPYDGSDHYLIDWNVGTTDRDILNANHWNTVADECYGNEALFSEDKEYIYPGDKTYLEKYYVTASDETRFRLNTVPYPFQGNPLTAKIIILSLNAGYVTRANDYFAKILQCLPQLAEGVMCFMRDNLRLKVKGFMPMHYASDKYPNIQDAYNMLGDWYWYNILSKWEEEGLTTEDIFSNVALIQYIPYASERANHKDYTLPSQIFAKKMIQHIANTKDTIFVVPRAVKKWSGLLGATWQKLKNEGRIIEGKNPRCQYLSSNNLGEEQYRKIIHRLDGTE